MGKSKYDILNNYLIKLNEFKFDYSLERIKKVIKLLKNPQNNFKVIHITGSNGKGSVAMFLTRVFLEEKIKIGTFLSPHFSDVRERILINNKKVKNKIFYNQGIELIKLIEKYKISLTYFEFLTVLAFMIFKLERVKIAIIEVGLGGRYDATNVEYKNKILSIITSISKEHTNYLGSTKLAILKEKEQIIKNGLCVCNIKDELLKNYLKMKHKNKIYFPDDFYILKKFYYKNNKLFLKVFDKKEKVENTYSTKMLEITQIKNILTVLTSLKILKNEFNLSDRVIKKAIGKMYIPGRLTYNKNGYFLSVAHNEEAIKTMLESVDKLWKNKKVIYIFSLLKDKKINEISRVIGKYKDKITVIITRINNERAMEVKKIQKYIAKNRIKNYLIENNKKALSFAFKLKKKNDIIIIGGSFYLVSNFVD